MSGTINFNFVEMKGIPDLVRLNESDWVLDYFRQTPNQVGLDDVLLMKDTFGYSAFGPGVRYRIHQDTADYMRFSPIDFNVDNVLPFGSDSTTSPVSTNDYYMFGKRRVFNSREIIEKNLVHFESGYSHISYPSVTGGSNITSEEWNLIYTTGLTVDLIGITNTDPSSSLVGESNNNVGSNSLPDINQDFLSGSAYEFEFAVAGEKYFKRFDNDYIGHTPLSVDAAGCISRTIRDDKYKSPAGFNRGLVLDAEEIRPVSTEAQINSLYDQKINFFYHEKDENEFYLYGDKTRSSDTSTFSRINVSLLFIQLKKLIKPAIRSVLFEQNDSTTRTRISNEITRLLRKIQGEDGITDFKVVCDETNNTPDIIDSNNLVVDVFVKPKKSINFIKIRFTNTENL